MKFEGESPDPFDALYHDHRLGEYTAGAPLYLLYIDNRYGYTADCTPAVTLEQPTVTGVSPYNRGQVNTNYSIHRLGWGFGPNATPGAVMISGAPLTATSWSPTSVTSPSWNSGGTPGSVTVKIRNSEGGQKQRDDDYHNQLTFGIPWKPFIWNGGANPGRGLRASGISRAPSATI